MCERRMLFMNLSPNRRVAAVVDELTNHRPPFVRIIDTVEYRSKRNHQHSSKRRLVTQQARKKFEM